MGLSALQRALHIFSDCDLRYLRSAAHTKRVDAKSWALQSGFEELIVQRFKYYGLV